MALLIQNHKLISKYEDHKIDFVTYQKVFNPIMIWTVYLIKHGIINLKFSVSSLVLIHYIPRAIYYQIYFGKLRYAPT